MKLIIARHGEAESGNDDFHRNLTDRGRADVARVTGLIRATGWNVTEIRSSPVLRAQQSAAIIAETLGGFSVQTEPALAPGLDLDQAIEMLDVEPNSNAVVWVFHAPCVSRLASHLTGLAESCFYFPAGTMMALNLPLPAPVGRSILCWAIPPEFLRGFK